MNSKLERLVEYCNENGIDLGEAEINVKWSYVQFRHENETRANFRAIKRAIEKWETEGSPPYLKLVKNVTIMHLINGEEVTDTWNFRWSGAYSCKISYNCEAQPFSDDGDDQIEDYFLEKTEKSF